MRKKASYEEIESSKLYPVKVFHCCNTNSTPFTECCQCACISEETCPSCGKYVIYYDCTPNARQGLRSSYAYNRGKHANR